MYYFLSGYTAKVAGTEVGVAEPQATFSAGFGAPFLVWHPTVYAGLLAKRLEQHQARVWLVNTGWSGGGYGTGARIKLRYTRAIIDAIHRGALADAPVSRDAVFGLEQVIRCPEVPENLLEPGRAWASAEAYRSSARKLADLFRSNFKAYGEQAGADVIAAGPLA
jgi:phosphoenolpyruvate carboxykinase (ATP)